MIIERVEVKNFRSLLDIDLLCDNLTAIIGRNGAGKSAILYAIEVFYDVNASITIEDFFNKDNEREISIRITYGNLSEKERVEFQTYIQDGKLIVTKIIGFEGDKIQQRYYGAALQIPEFAEVRKAKNKTDFRQAFKDLNRTGKLAGLEDTAKSADEAEEIMSRFESKRKDLLEPIERIEQFFGTKNIGGGKLDKYTRFVLIPAVREAADEIDNKKGSIYQLLDMIVMRKIEARKDIRQFKAEFEEKIKSLYTSDNLTELRELGSSITATLEKFSPGALLILDWADMKMPQIPLPIARASVVEDDFESEVSRKGHGLQRALILTLLQHLAITEPIVFKEEVDSDEKPDSEENEEQIIPDLIIAIEEPELYLHPARCRYLSKLLVDLSQSSEIGLGAENQIIYVSHSPYFVDLNRFDQVRIAIKEKSDTSPIRFTTLKMFTMEEAKGIAARISDRGEREYTAEGFKVRAYSVMSIIVNEGFFGDLVLVVEGQSEVGAIWQLQEHLHKEWARLGIVVVSAGGKNNVDKPTIVFRGFGIPTYFLFDGDVKNRGAKDEARTIEANHRLQRLAGATLEDFPDTQFNTNWGVFSNCLEESIKESIGEENYFRIRDTLATELGYGNKPDLLKNAEGTAAFIERVYSQGLTISSLESLVNSVTEYYRQCYGD